MTSSTNPKRLILFDVDGTLLKSKSMSRQAFKEAYKELHDIDLDINDWPHDGKTDMKIHYDIMEKHKMPIDHHTALELAKKMDEICLTKDFEGTILLPGVKELLEALKKDKDIHTSIVTGGTEGMATCKLRYTDIEKYFEFKGFGHTSTVRSDIVNNTIKLFEDKYGPISKNNIFIIGDTVHDIKAARGAGVKVIAVANGCGNREDLEKEHPDFIFNDLTDIKNILKVINNG